MNNLDPITPLLRRIQACVDACPQISPPELEEAIIRIGAELGMSVQTRGTASARSGVPLEWDVDIKGWSFDAREWVRRELGHALGEVKVRS